MRLNRTHKRPLVFTIGNADRDPMFTEAVWYDNAMALTPPSEHVQVAGVKWDLAPLPPPSDLQQNDHVMRYWSWRLDRMEAKRNG